MFSTQYVSLLTLSLCFAIQHTVSSFTIPKDGICASSTWNRNGITVAGGHWQGSSLNQLSSPNGLFVADDDAIYIADTTNRRVVKWAAGATTGEVVVGGDDIQTNDGKKLSQLTKVVVDKKGTIYVCDRDNKRVLLFTKNDKRGQTIMDNISCWGLALDDKELLYVSDLDEHLVKKWPGNQIVAGGNGKGSALNQLSYPYQIFVDHEQTVFVTDRGNNRIVKWLAGSKEGQLAINSNGFGNAADQLYKPMAVTVDDMGTVYVVEYINTRVVRWFNGAKSGDVIIGGPGYGSAANQLYFPRDLVFDRHGNLYVADTNNHRIQKYTINKSSCSTMQR